MRKPDDEGRCEDHGRECCLRFRESWTVGSIYRPGDAVPYNGSSYVAIHWNQNDPPPSANWAAVASKGDPGPAGPLGPAGPRGPAGPPGAAGQGAFGPVQTFVGIDQVQFGTDGNDFAVMNVPAGSYVIWATVPISNADGDAQNWDIKLRVSRGAIVGGASGRLAALGSGSASQIVPILATCLTDGDTTITFRGFGFNIGTWLGVADKTCSIVAMPTSIL